MSATFACKNCGAKLKLKAAPIQPTKIACPKCQQTTVITPDGAFTDKPKPTKPAAVPVGKPAPTPAPTRRGIHPGILVAIGGGVLFLLLLVGATGAFLFSYRAASPNQEHDPVAVAPIMDDLKKPAIPQENPPKIDPDLLAKEKQKAEDDKLAREKQKAEDDRLAKEKEKADADRAAKQKTEEQSQLEYLAAMKEASKWAGDKKYDEAIAAYRKALAVRPSDAEATQKLADARIAQAAALAAEQRQKELGALKEQAEEARAKKQFAVAIELYRAYLILEKDDAATLAALKGAQAELAKDATQKKMQEDFDAHIQAAEKALATENFGAAAKELAAARAIFPMSRTLARVQRLAEQLFAQAQARTDPKKDVQPPPVNPNAKAQNAALNDLLKRAYAARLAQRWNEAEQFYRKVLEIDRSDVQAALGLEAVQRGQQFALFEYQRLMTLGRQAMQQNQYLPAINYFQQANQVYPENTEVLPLIRQAEILHEQARKVIYAQAMEQGRTLAGQLKFKEALQAYELAQATYPLDIQARAAVNDLRLAADTDRKTRYNAAMGRGRTLKAQKKYPDALQSFEDALRQIPNDNAAQFERNDVLRLINLTPVNPKDSKTKKKNDPINPPPNPGQLTPEQQARFAQTMNQGYNALRMGRPDQAIPFFQAALDISPGNPMAESSLKFARDQMKKGKGGKK